MSCEVCGGKIIGKPNSVVVEGVKLKVCGSCTNLGEQYTEKIRPPRTSLAQTSMFRRPQYAPRAEALPKQVADYELVEDYAQQVKGAREKLGMTQEELARLLKEKLSVLQKIECGKMAPDLKTSRMLEHTLRIKLLVQGTERSEANLKLAKPVELSLGDIVKFKQRKSAGS